LSQLVGGRFPTIDAMAAIRAGHVWVNGFPVTNPETLVAPDASLVVRTPQPLAGEAKLRAAIAAFAPVIHGRLCVDVGASTGGFTRVLLEAGARRVYAVDAGFGQLLGSLRQDPRVVNLERTNLGALDTTLVPETVELVAIDVSYISLARAIPQLQLRFARGAELVALVKPMYELGLAAPPPDDRLAEALQRAVTSIDAAGWQVAGAIDSPVLGGRGAKEMLIHARRRT
jgi:23S rRNA (cytidine1920-2'-O)/16S rRNA (cytidine1409-2'-O)-methyltransferase